MSINSQEQTIYRSLAGQIQLGFFDDGERFPSVQEIARRYRVSYCPAQRALKALERAGLVQLCRGRETLVIAKPYHNYLDSPVFRARALALADLCRSLELLSPAITVEGICRMESGQLPAPPEADAAYAQRAKYLYRGFERALRALGSRTVLSLYYDVGAFAGSALLDILSEQPGGESGVLLRELSEGTLRSLRDCEGGNFSTAFRRQRDGARRFFALPEQFLAGAAASAAEAPAAFQWEPNKGRTRYCDVIAIDLVCGINQGKYPVGTLLPSVGALSDVYHVSTITIRRTVGVLNQLGVTATINGVGTRVIFAGDATLLQKRRGLMLDENLLDFLEAVQLFALTCAPVLEYTFPHLSGETLRGLTDAVSSGDRKAGMVNAISACLQAVTRECPLAAVREIYGKITLQLLKGSVLRLNETGEERVDCWSAHSAQLRESLTQRDGARFARLFRRVAADNFRTSKQTLLELKVAGAEAVAAPAELSGME